MVVKGQPEEQTVRVNTSCPLIAIVWNPPADTNNQLVAIPILIGDDLSIPVPSPNCPSTFRPQAHNVPSVFIAAVCQNPADTDDQLVSVPTWTGVVPYPAPHAHNVPSVFIATVCQNPADTDDQLLSVPIWVGEYL